eukprot:scaffold1277_cov253-Pinguiococcus_pyrenoidosus.AAC.21
MDRVTGLNAWAAARTVAKRKTLIADRGDASIAAPSGVVAMLPGVPALCHVHRRLQAGVPGYIAVASIFMIS